MSPSRSPVNSSSARAGLRCAVVVAFGATAALAALAPRAAAQERQERFVTQVLIVHPFDGPDRKLGTRAADAVRDHLDGVYDRKELRVVSRGEMVRWMDQSGFNPENRLGPGEERDLARHFRADERIMGTASRSGGAYRIDARMVLFRDDRLVQPYPAAEAPTLDSAAAIVAREIVESRKQLGPLRRCENHDRDGMYDQAIAAAREGIAAYPHGILARTCLMLALTQLGRPDSVLAAGREVLAIAPASPVALDLVAQAFESVNRKDSAAVAWTRLYAASAHTEEIVERVGSALARVGHAHEARPIVVQGVKDHPESLSLLRLEWLVLLADGAWKDAAEAGERLVVRDSTVRGDPTYYARQASAYRSADQPERAVATAAAGVARFPDDPALFVLYTRLVRGEADAALPRGLARFPASAELRVLEAQTLKAAGKVAESMAATKRALALDPRLSHGWLQLAQLELDAGQPDSAYAALQTAASSGEDAALLGQFALAKGNALYKAAVASRTIDDFSRAGRFLQLADRLAPSPEAKFLVGASAFSVSQLAATDAPKTRSCELSRLASESLAAAEANLSSGSAAFPDASAQYRGYVEQLRPYVASQLKAYCG